MILDSSMVNTAASSWFYCWLKDNLIVLDSSMVEHSAVNRVVVGSSPTRGVFVIYGDLAKW